jgi:hypothetical protein
VKTGKSASETLSLLTMAYGEDYEEIECFWMKGSTYFSISLFSCIRSSLSILLDR